MFSAEISTLVKSVLEIGSSASERERGRESDEKLEAPEYTVTVVASSPEWRSGLRL